MESGAKAAISGFRKQALYTLGRMLRDAESDRQFQPEGEEDLAIYDGARLTNVVQVKALSSPLTLSDLGRPFFRRVAGLEEIVKIEIASFGVLGPELEGVKQGNATEINSVRGKLEESYGLTAARAASVVSRFQFVRVNEAEISEAVLAHLRETATGGNPESAFDLLTWWMFDAAESKKKITFSGMRDRLQSIGRYFAERRAKYEEWFTTIKPLEESEKSTERKQELARQYYRGAAARYSHICAGLDVRRETLLSEIDQKFGSGDQVVVLHGASGQGKTSLALRYLHDYVPAEWRLMVTAIDDRRHAASVANAIADHLHVVEAPLYLLIDVAPTDLEWVALVKELLDRPNVRILVAIREEDLARRRASNAELGFPADIALDFSPEEAEVVYQHLEDERGSTNGFPTFEDGWERFGGHGPLLEFVYLITQTQSLRDVLAAQVQRLRDEVQSGQLAESAFRFLHICALATSFETRLQIRPLARHLNLVDPVGILQRFEKEYLLRESADQRTVEALHPVRSSLLAEILDDPAFAPRDEVALEALPFVPEADLQTFLLYVFSRLPESSSQFHAALSELQVSGWAGVAGVGRALMWWGIRRYQDDNRTLLDEAQQLAGEAWSYFVNPDFVGVSESDIGNDLLDTLRSVNPQFVASLEEIRSQFPDTDTIFAPFVDWLSSCQVTRAPSSEADWAGCAEMLLWAGRLDIAPPGSVEIRDIPADTLPLDLLSDISAALYESSPAQHVEFLSEYDGVIRTRFRRETRTPVLEDTDEELFAHFIVPSDAGQEEPALVEEPAPQSWQRGSQTPSISDSSSGDLNQSLNEQAVTRASLLRSLYPQRERFCTQGYGHQITNLVGGFALPHDESHKTMPRSALPLQALIEVNSIFRTLDEYRRRPAGWRQFAELLLDVREILAGTLLRLQRSLVTYFKRRQQYDVIGGRLSTEMWDRAVAVAKTSPYLPTSAVDEWGLSSETKGKHTENRSQRSISVASSFVFRRHQSFKKAFDSYLTSASNFFDQAGIVCFCHSRWGRQVENREAVVAASTEHGYGEDRLRLSKHYLFELMNSLVRMQEAFDGRLGALVDQERIQRIKRRESQLFPSLWALWYQFCHQPERLLRNANVRAVSAFERAASDLRRELATRLAESAEGWSTSILDESFQWKEQPALALRVELDSITDLETARTGVFEVLGAVLGNPEPGSLGQYAREYYWPHVLVIPTINGTALEKGCWAIPASVFFNMDSDSGADRPWLHPLQPMSDDQMHAVGLTAIELRSLSEFDKLQQRFAEAGALFAHMSNFIDLIPQLDEVGEQILQDYLAEPLRSLSACLVDAHDLLPPAISRVRELCAGRQDIEEALVAPFEEIYDVLEGLDGERFDIALPDTTEKATWFGELAGHAVILRTFEVSGSLEAFLDSVDDSDAGQTET